MTLEFQPVGGVSSTLGEGPVYDDRRNVLWYCDIVERAIRQFDIAAGTTRTWNMPSEVCSLGLARSGLLVVALRKEVGLFDPDKVSFDAMVAIEADNPRTRLNDGKVGPDGAFWVGTMDDGDGPKEEIAALYRVTADGRAEKKATGIKVSNGLAFSTDGRTMFHSDSRGPWIDRWDLDPTTGTISNRTRIARLDDATGRPDGGACDVEGNYWSAGVSAARLNRFSREGKLLEAYPIPVAGPTMPCFAGPDLKTLYVTSLRFGREPAMLAKYPLTGVLMRARSPVAGVPVGRFAD
ncbi:MAG TPA: SMP-30/gluconolactonase/LRE family protein [Bauldia sp.]|nr:SMP-30/gluconolactonase/LRE family protein [Bauldia sp.]